MNLPSLTSWFVPQHQQQVVQAMERAKQVTMGELNASIGVRGLPPLPHSVCTLSSHIFIFPPFLFFLRYPLAHSKIHRFYFINI